MHIAMQHLIIYQSPFRKIWSQRYAPSSMLRDCVNKVRTQGKIKTDAETGSPGKMSSLNNSGYTVLRRYQKVLQYWLIQTMLNVLKWYTVSQPTTIFVNNLKHVQGGPQCIKSMPTKWAIPYVYPMSGLILLNAIKISLKLSERLCTSSNNELRSGNVRGMSLSIKLSIFLFIDLQYSNMQL